MATALNDTGAPAAASARPGLDAGQRGPLFAFKCVLTERGARLARWHMASALAEVGYGHESVRWVEQVAAEMLANALRHGCVGADSPAGLQVTAVDDGLLIEVTDRGPGVPQAAAGELGGECGRGLFLVEMLADAWGVRKHDGAGKTVWAALSRARLARLVAGEEPC